MENKQTFKDFLTSAVGKIVMTVVFMFIIYGAMILCIKSNVIYLALPIAIACFIFGWKTLGPTNPFLMIFASGNFLIFYYIFKFILSLLIGYFVAPFQLCKLIVKHISSNN